MNLETIQSSLVELGATWGIRILGVLAALLVAFSVAGWARKATSRALGRLNIDPTLAKFFANLARYAVLVAAILGCLGVFGIETTSFAALIGAAGLAVGLAFQGTLSNFAAGIMLLIFRPFRAGDVVVVAGQTGVVQEIELFTTELTALDNRRIIIPNSSIFGAIIENLTHHPVRRVDISVGTAYAADIDRTRTVLEAAVQASRGVLDDPAPQVLLASLGASSVDWQVRAWCKTEDYWTVCEGVIRDVKVALDSAGIGIPFPQTEVHLAPESQATLRSGPVARA